MNDTEKAFIDLHKKYLFLQHKLARYEMNGVFPPEHLLKKIGTVTQKKAKFL